MQNDAGVGRVLLASLHQAIAEVLPGRLEFYEPWLAPTGPGEQTLNLESFSAMLAFLEEEGELTDAVFHSAGRHAAFRCFADLPAVRRAVLSVLPHQLRAERVVRLLVDLLPALYPGSRFDMTRRGGTVFINIDGSPFCGPRAPADSSSCGFYAGAIATFLRQFRIRGSLKVSRCRASGSKSCLLMVLPGQARAASEPPPPLEPTETAEAIELPRNALEAEPTEVEPTEAEPIALLDEVPPEAPVEPPPAELPAEHGAASELPVEPVTALELPAAPEIVAEVQKPAEPVAVPLPAPKVPVSDRAAVEARWNAIVLPPVSGQRTKV